MALYTGQCLKSTRPSTSTRLWLSWAGYGAIAIQQKKSTEKTNVSFTAVTTHEKNKAGHFTEA